MTEATEIDEIADEVISSESEQIVQKARAGEKKPLNKLRNALIRKSRKIVEVEDAKNAILRRLQKT